MKLFQILNDRCYYHLPGVAFPDTEVYYAPNIEFAEAPDYVFEGWGYDGNAEGDARFIKPIAPEGFEYDENSGTFYDPNNLPADEPEKLSYDDLVALVGELKAQVDNLTEEQARAWEAVAEGAPLTEVALGITAKTKIGEVK